MKHITPWEGIKYFWHVYDGTGFVYWGLTYQHYVQRLEVIIADGLTTRPFPAALQLPKEAANVKYGSRLWHQYNAHVLAAHALECPCTLANMH